MDSTRQLRWIQRNRGKRDRVREAGTLIQELTERTEAANDAASIATAIAGAVDREFRTHCRIATTHSATLVIRVDKASLVYPMRLRWLSALSRGLSETRLGRRISRIIFQFGNAGVEIPDPKQQLHQSKVVE